MILSRVQMDNFLIIWYYIKGFKIYHIIKEARKRFVPWLLSESTKKARLKPSTFIAGSLQKEWSVVCVKMR